MWSFFSRDSTKVFPYEIGDKISSSEDDDYSIWKLHDGKQKVNYLLFIFLSFERQFTFLNFMFYLFFRAMDNQFLYLYLMLLKTQKFVNK